MPRNTGKNKASSKKETAKKSALEREKQLNAAKETPANETKDDQATLHEMMLRT